VSTDRPGCALSAIQEIAHTAEAGGWTQTWRDGLLRLERGDQSVVVAYNRHGGINTLAFGVRQIRARDKLGAVLDQLGRGAAAATVSREPGEGEASRDPARHPAELDLEL
jgi:hypothetical protein